mmetsp:Transcript_137675/g.294255  ORF Transcript_137675/g.294255 Transcript_137675/m.294255 type:complete len:405 (-) Transcript_137675:93-1307(-)
MLGLPGLMRRSKKAWGHRSGSATEDAKFLRWGSLLVMTLQNTALGICMRLSRATGAPKESLYLVTTAVVCSEALKLLTSGFLAMLVLAPSEVVHEVLNFDAVLMLVPAGLYTLQNNLQYIAAGHLDASVYQVLYQMKLVTTAIFSVTMLGRRLSGRQWLGIVVCALGVAVVQISTLKGEDGRTEDPAAVTEMNPMLGFISVAVACITSGLAGVYTEKVFKTSTTNLWVRNMQLALFSVAIGSAGIVINDGSVILEKGFFVGYTPVVWFVICLQAFGGIVMAVVVKYADNIAKGFATGLSIIASCCISASLFDFVPNQVFALGVTCVLASIGIYSCGGGSATPGASSMSAKGSPSVGKRKDKAHPVLFSGASAGLTPANGHSPGSGPAAVEKLLSGTSEREVGEA